MTATLRITHIATGADPVTVSLLRTDGVLVAEHRLKPGETHNVAVTDGQRIAIIEPARSFADQLNTYRAKLPVKTEITDADIHAALDQLSRQAESQPTRAAP